MFQIRTFPMTMQEAGSSLLIIFSIDKSIKRALSSYSYTNGVLLKEQGLHKYISFNIVCRMIYLAITLALAVK